MADPEKFVEWVTGQPMALVEATNSVFRASASHSVGLVPDPGASPDGLKALFNDGAFKVIATVTVPATTQYSYRPPTEKIFTTAGSQSYSYPSGTVALWVEVGGAGGPGGGVIGSAALGLGAGGGGGAAGARSRGLFTVASISATVTIVIGTAGLATATGTGTDGNQSQFGIYIVASGGSAGSRGNAGSFDPAPGGNGNAATGGLINISGDSGEFGNAGVSGTGPTVKSGEGGSNPPYGYGGKPAAIRNNTGNAQAGNPANGFGSGGSGAVVSGTTSTTTAGGAATDGFVYIMEIYSLSAT